ncbi:MAG: carbohydrate porin [Gammaproteobacteria bacterium]|nr:carbohydrate porin [Gammaproteobacteria bacterium]
MRKSDPKSSARDTVSHWANQRFVALAVCLLATSGIEASEITWEGGVTSVFQDADDSRVDSELTASADLFITLPRSNGEWFLYIEASTSPDDDGVSAIYPTANADAGSVLDRDGNSHIQVSELHYTFHMTGERRLMVGLVNPSAWLDRSRITNDENTHFLNGNFKNNATIEFPDYTLGAVMRWLGSKSRPEVSLVVASSRGISELPDRSYQDLLDISSDDRDAFVGADAKWLRDRRTFRLGAWLRTENHPVAGSPNGSEKNYGLYGVLGWHDAGNALNFRLGVANKDVSVAAQFAAIAYERSTPIGLLGLGLSKTRISNSFRQADLDDVAAAEAFFRISIGDSNGQISPSVQYVENPGFDASGATSSSSAVVAGVRFHWSF